MTVPRILGLQAHDVVTILLRNKVDEKRQTHKNED